MAARARLWVTVMPLVRRGLEKVHQEKEGQGEVFKGQEGPEHFSGGLVEGENIDRG